MIRVAFGRTRSIRDSHESVACGAVSGNLRYARSCTVTTNRDAFVGGGRKFGAKKTSDRTNHSTRGSSNRWDSCSNIRAGNGVARSIKLERRGKNRFARHGASARRAFRYHATYVVSGSTSGSSRTRCHV